MIIQAILNALLTVLYALTSAISIPQLPPEVGDYIGSFTEYIGMGTTILGQYTPLTYLFTLFSIVISIDIGIGIYRFVMFIIKKIPMANIQD